MALWDAQGERRRGGRYSARWAVSPRPSPATEAPHDQFSRRRAALGESEERAEVPGPREAWHEEAGKARLEGVVEAREPVGCRDERQQFGEIGNAGEVGLYPVARTMRSTASSLPSLSCTRAAPAPLVEAATTDVPGRRRNRPPAAWALATTRG